MGRNYETLRRKIIGKYGKLGTFAEVLGIRAATLSQKLNGSSDWSRVEIEKVQRLLELTVDEVWLIFFADNVQDCTN